jgi:hypothetical protein
MASGIEQDPVAFCRVSELGFLRLLTNAHVMGSDILSPVQAWRVYDEWRSDDRVIFLSERKDFTEQWRQLGNQISGGPNAWTDAYLAVFAGTTMQRSSLWIGRFAQSARLVSTAPLV